jgi:hypothetical protein
LTVSAICRPNYQPTHIGPAADDPVSRATNSLWLKEVDKMTPPSIAGTGMRLRIALMILALFAGADTAPAASTYADASRLLDGEWSNDSVVLRIDAERAQASITPDRPFEWKRFVIRDARGDEVVFAIGSELYEATVAGDSLTLTGTSFRGERVLFRAPELRGTTAD